VLRPPATTLPRAVLLTAYVLVAAAPLLAVLLSGGMSGIEPRTAVGNALGLVAAPLLALQLVLSLRFPPIERIFGLDRMLRFHRVMACVALGLLGLHGALKLSESGGYIVQTLFGDSWPVLLGIAAAAAAALQVSVALGRRRLRLAYERWLGLHGLVAGGALLAFAHAPLLGQDFPAPALRVVWGGLVLLVLVIGMQKKIVAPLQARRSPWRVKAVAQETPDVWTVRLEPMVGPRRPQWPGQFCLIRPLTGRVPKERHPFTMSCAPGDPDLTITVKRVGDFTAHIRDFQPGDEALVEQPLGRFSYVLHDDAPLLLVAGGVGITPLMSMLRHLRDTQDARPIRLIYGSKTEADIIFRDELDDMARRMADFGVTHILSVAAPEWTGARGHVDRGVLAPVVEELGRERVGCYVCGPPPMMDLVVRSLRRIGVPGKHVYSERFML